jgi:hypothetical protein
VGKNRRRTGNQRRKILSASHEKQASNKLVDLFRACLGLVSPIIRGF